MRFSTVMAVLLVGAVLVFVMAVFRAVVIGRMDGMQAGACRYRQKAVRVALCLRMDAPAAAHLNDTALSDDQRIEPDPSHAGKVLVCATVNDSPALAWWLRGFGESAERVDVPEAREGGEIS